MITKLAYTLQDIQRVTIADVTSFHTCLFLAGYYVKHYFTTKLTLSLAIKNWYVNFTRTRKKYSVKLSKWMVNDIFQVIHF